MRRLLQLLALVPSLAALTACGPSTYGSRACEPHRDSTDAPVEIAALLIGTAIVAAEHAEARNEEHEAARDAAENVPPPAVPSLLASPRDSVAEGAPPRFDGMAARAALARVDLGPCRASAGAPRGYGHAKVTFAPSGGVAEVLIDGPTGLGDGVVACVGGRLGQARVGPFTGAPTTVRFQTFVP